MGKKVLIVGGIAGGASTAARLRRLDENAEIIMFERDEYISFANCGLPYYIGETIKERQKLLIQTPESMSKRFNIDVRINSEVIGIDPNKKVVKVKSKDNGTYEESYDYIVLSPGAKAIKPNIEGIDSNKIFTLRNIPDTDRIKSYVDQKDVNSAIVIGGGYVGVEMAENLKEKGLNVTLVEAAPHILSPFDSDIIVTAEKELEDNGVSLILNDGVKSFNDANNSIEVTLNSNKKITADLVILAIGVTPDTSFIKDSGIKLGAKGHILVNDKMETNIENIYAVGDAIEVVDFVNKQNTAIPLAGPANKQGRIAADNICGLNTTYKGTQGTSIIKVFGLTAASTGNNERTLKRLNVPYKVIYVHPASHATYYPGAMPLTLKLIFNDKGKILGAQSIGYDGVDKRIDVIATTMRLGGTVQDLTELELSYAPPFSSAKDPVNMAGYVAENVLSGKTDILTPEEYLEYDKENTILLDVRTEMEFNNGHIEGAVNIPVDDLRNRINELDKNKEIIEYCQVGLRGHVASRILSQHGFKVRNITGGYKSALSLDSIPKKSNNNTDSKKPVINPDTQTVESEVALDSITFDKSLDACGLCCPGPLVQVKSSMDSLNEGEVLKVSATDPGFYEDIKSWCHHTDSELINVSKDKGTITAFIKKNNNNSKLDNTNANLTTKDNKTMVVFSGDLDKAIASFIIANGAASMGKKVTMFFTFWGLNILRKHEKVSVKKGFMDSMFGLMMPRGSKKLKLSNMNMMGMGAKMIRMVMKNKNVTSLEDLIKLAMNNGVEIVACQMSMDVMGLKKDELIDGVKIGGVGYYLGEAEDSNVNLFI
ncbi:CoA-disulfide reductase [Clostridium cylindrosporum]|uniref:Coenzyme A disulfide reductase Cdr n=1 Tax=Clostridium cylindrosporum DSM 605 TaxID=1121307 RepID=A0A0J8FZU5_CLOCY|nr:CoA-disulfide reductase [Clostridium cylindrosporum]KMT21076.1 coenzyme A disulfide reductase Cdr [Clostridium cylindrosporum DSM 605]